MKKILFCITFFHIFFNGHASLGSHGLSLSPPLQEQFLKVFLVEPEEIWIKFASSFFLDGSKYVYAEVSVTGKDLMMGSWTGAILAKAPLMEAEWADVEIFALNERVHNANELRNPRRERINKLIEKGRKIAPDQGIENESE